VYLFTLFSFFPKWAGLILDISGMNRSVIARWMLAVLGASSIVGGLAVAWLYRSRAGRLPRATTLSALLALVLALAGGLGGCGSPTHPAVEVFSALPYAQAQEQARAQQRLLLVDATASWCGPCRKMEETTWPDARVAAWLQSHAIAVQVDVDAEPALAQQLRIEVMPTLIVFRDGKEISRRKGYAGPDELLAWLGPLAGG
jgi:thiol:disulfide interchange protein